MGEKMQKIQRMLAVFLVMVFLLAGVLASTEQPGVTAEAAKKSSAAKKSARVSKIRYTIKKGKKKKITAIVKGSAIKSKKKKMAAVRTWKSSSPKIVKVTKTKKIQAVKAGSAYVRGYNKNKKKVISIRVTVKPVSKPKLTRTTANGKVKGKKNSAGDAMVWYGIPYGASTAGENRWKAPQPVEPWTGVKSAVSKKKDAVKASGTSYTGTEDCLYVNVYRPYTKEKNLPVMVYIHGGSNETGTANGDCTGLAVATNSVIVSVSYRLGAFGFLSHPALRDGTDEENSGNYTLLDIRQALVWVRDEIGHFGGNAGNVTLCGFSAGGRDTLMCVISPIMKGLFHKAVVMSGGMTTSAPEEGQESSEEKLAAVLVNRGVYEKKSEALSCVQSLSNAEIRELFDSLTTGEVAGMYRSFDLRMKKFPQGFTDGTVLPRDGFAAIAAGDYNRVPIILGSDATEFSTFAWKDTSFFGVDYTIWDLAVLPFNSMDMLAKGIKYGSQLQSEFNIENTADELYRDPGHEKIYAFRFQWGTDAGVTDPFYSQYVGAYHGAGRNFLFGIYPNSWDGDSPTAISDANKKGRTALTRQMRQYVKNFLASGNPNGGSLTKWTTWMNDGGVNKIMYFNAGKKSVTSGMSTVQYDQTVTLGAMRDHLTEAEYGYLVNKILDGRFFMPAAVLPYTIS